MAIPGAYTFNGATASLSQKDQARLRVGDFNGRPQWFWSDQTILSQIAAEGFDEACAQYAESIGAACVQLAKTVVQSDVKREYQDRSTAMFELADRIRNLAQPSPGDPPNYGALAGRTRGPNLRTYERLLGAGCDERDHSVDPDFGISRW